MVDWRDIDNDVLKSARAGQGGDERLFQKIVPSRLPNIGAPTGLVVCSDGFQRADVNNHISRIWYERQAPELIHEVKFAGASWFGGYSDINSKFNETSFIVDQIKKGLGLARIDEAVILLGHYPCGLADSFDLNLYDCTELLVHGRGFIERKFPELKVACAMQVDYKGNHKVDRHDKRTYHINTSYWPTFVESVRHLYEPKPDLIKRKSIVEEVESQTFAAGQAE